MIDEGNGRSPDDDVINFPGAAKVRIPVTITMRLKVRERAKEEAEFRGLNFSAYIEKLITRDINNSNLRRGLNFEQLE